LFTQLAIAASLFELPHLLFRYDAAIRTNACDLNLSNKVINDYPWKTKTKIYLLKANNRGGISDHAIVNRMVKIKRFWQ
jgi:hypothetical protein